MHNSSDIPRLSCKINNHTTCMYKSSESCGPDTCPWPIYSIFLTHWVSAHTTLKEERIMSRGLYRTCRRTASACERTCVYNIYGYTDLCLDTHFLSRHVRGPVWVRITLINEPNLGHKRERETTSGEMAYLPFAAIYRPYTTVASTPTNVDPLNTTQNKHNKQQTHKHTNNTKNNSAE